MEDAVKGDKPSNGLFENAMMLLRSVIRTVKCHVESCTQEEHREDSRVSPWLVDYAGSILSRCQKGRDGRTPSERLHGKKPTQEFVPFGEKVLERPISSEPLNRMNPSSECGCETRQTLRPSEALQVARVAMRSDLESEHKLIQTLAEPRFRNVSKQL